MQVREAKDFLVHETAKQASIEGVPLSDLEKRMMYFTESGYVPEDPIALNEEFEAQYDTDEYETKISKLLHRAYQRLGKENEQTRKAWENAIKCLRRGDHYLLVMWDLSSSGEMRDPSPSEEWSVAYVLKILAGSLGVIILMFAVVFAVEKFAPQLLWVRTHIPVPNPRVLLTIFLLIIAAGFLFPSQLGRLSGWLLDKVVGRFIGRKGKPDES